MALSSPCIAPRPVVRRDPCFMEYKVAERQTQPEILNMANNPKETKNSSSPQELLDAGKLGNLMTQDVLMHLQKRPITVNTYGVQLPLHVACLFGSIKAVEFLLRQPNIEVNSANGAEESPLGIACRAAHLEVAILLLQNSKGIRVDQHDDVRNTPILYLAGQGIYPVWSEEPSHDELKALVQAMLGASENDSSGTRYTEFSRLCMEAACRQGHIPLLSILIEIAPHSISLPNQDGWTALHFAILSGEDEAVDLLLEAEADTGTDAKDSDQMQPLELALAYIESSIAEKIRNKWTTKTESSETPMKKSSSVTNHMHLDYLKAQIWPGKIKENKETKGSTVKSEFDFGSVLVRDILKPENLQVASKEFMWCHLPTNNWHWAKALCEKFLKNDPDPSTLEGVIECLQKTFESTGHSPPLCDHCYLPIKDIKMITAEDPETNRRGMQKDATQEDATQPDATQKDVSRRESPHMLTVLPLIEIDYLAGFQKEENDQALADSPQPEKVSGTRRHIDGMRDLYRSTISSLHHPRTLDHYYHTDLDDARRNALNKDQVITRYLKSLHPKRTQRTENQTCISPSEHPFITWARQLLRSRRISFGTTQGAVDRVDVEHQRISKEDESCVKEDGRAAPSSAQDQNSESILVVSQLWLIKLDNTMPLGSPPCFGSNETIVLVQLLIRLSYKDVVVTLFPQRWNPSNRGLDPLSMELKRLLQETIRIEKGLNSRNLYHEMVKRSMQYRSLIEIDGERVPLAYWKVFSKEVLRVSQKVDIQYGIFKKSLGTSVKVFRQLSENVTECLMNINDVLHEIQIIRQVLDHRSSVWESMHQIPSRAKEKLPRGEASSNAKCAWGIDNCNPYEVRDSSYFDTDKLERDAMIVQAKTKDLMGLLHGQAGTENSLNSTRQANLLAVFTVLTVVFSPISVVLGVLGLQIESFTPEAWSKWQVGTGSVLSVVVTGALCLCWGWGLRQFQKMKSSSDDGRIAGKSPSVVGAAKPSTAHER